MVVRDVATKPGFGREILLFGPVSGRADIEVA